MTNEIEHSGVVALGDINQDVLEAFWSQVEVQRTGSIWGLGKGLKAAILASLARPAQEPVAWQPRYKQSVVDHHRSQGADFWEYAMSVYPTKAAAENYGHGGHEARPLYAAPQPFHTTNCCKCGRIIDTREKKDGGDDFGAQLSDGRWTCSIECDDAVIDPYQSVSACVACEGKPCGEHNPCAVCGRSSIAAPQPVHSQVAGTPGLLTETDPSDHVALLRRSRDVIASYNSTFKNSGGLQHLRELMDDLDAAITPATAQNVPVKLTEHEKGLLKEVRRTNDNPNGFSSHIISGGGTKGSNFHRIALEKRAASLVQKGLLATTPFGFEITSAGRDYLAPSPSPTLGWVTVRVEDTGDGLIINPDDALKWRLRDDQAYEGHFLPDGTYRIAIPACLPAASEGSADE